jgi:hypothetical protein
LAPATTALGVPVKAPILPSGPVGQIIVPPLPGNGDTFGAPASSRAELGGAPFWLVSLLAWLLLGSVAVALAVRRISLPAKREAG